VELRITLNDDAFVALCSSASESLQNVVDVIELPSEVGSLNIDSGVAPGTGELRITLKPSDAFRDFVTTLRARNVDSCIRE
jgi:hypothetical protein